MAGGHSVPIEKIVNRYGKSIINCAKIIRIADRVYIYDNSRDNQAARLLFRTVDGVMFKQYVDELPRWAQIL